VERVPNSAFLQEQLAEASCSKFNSKSYGLGKRSAKPPTDSCENQDKTRIGKRLARFCQEHQEERRANPKLEGSLFDLDLEGIYIKTSGILRCRVLYGYSVHAGC
jgi:hypothetical protein